MANPIHRSVLLDHQMIVDGVLMREMKDQTKTLNDETGIEESHLSHMRDGQKSGIQVGFFQPTLSKSNNSRRIFQGFSRR